MSVLSQKLEEASKLFQSHSFKKSLEAYEQCIRFAQSTQQDQSVIHNIQSTKATLEYILGDFDTALNTLNNVLHKDPCHFLSLLRRSQVFKKKNKLGRALKDLQKIFVFCPDNLQISAFKAEIEHILLKQGSNIETLSDSQDEQLDDQDEAATLNFMNLKQIDRKSSDFSSVNHRKSRVTILGDTLFQYQAEQQSAIVEKKNEQGQQELVSDKAIRTLKQIQLDDDQNNEESKAIKINVLTPKKPKRSILKNKATSIYIAEENQLEKKQKYQGRGSKLLEMLKSIDGKMIQSTQVQHEEGLNKQVQFRKSISQINPLQIVYDPSASAPSSQSGFNLKEPKLAKRKSCLKRQSFDGPDPKLTPKRSSRFEMLAADQVDGKLIHTRHRKDSIDKKQGNEQNGNKESDSDNEASSHNIFGSSDFVMTQQLKQKLGINQRISKSGSEDDNDSNSTPMKLKKKQSILKKNSSMKIHERKSSIREASPVEETSPKLKQKKSVVFNCTL